jgi:Ammonium Transporter Family
MWDGLSFTSLRWNLSLTLRLVILLCYHLDAVYEWAEGSGDFTMLGTQLIGVLFVFGWVSVSMGGFFFIINFLGWFRIDPLEEEVGMDLSRHKGSAYDMGETNADAIRELNNSRHSRGGSYKKAINTGDAKRGSDNVEGEETA